MSSFVDHLKQRGQHLHDRIISLREEVWAHKTNLDPATFYRSACTEQGIVSTFVFLVFHFMDILIRNNKKSDETNVDDLFAKHLIIFRHVNNYVQIVYAN